MPKIAHCENPRDIGLAFFIGNHVTGAVDLDPRRHQLIVGIKTDKNKNALGIDVAPRTGLRVFQSDVANARVVSVDCRDNRIVDNVNPRFGENTLLIKS